MSLTATTPVDAVLERLALQRAALEALCLANGVRRLAVFGSVVRDDFDPSTSDVDVILRIDAPSCPAYLDRYFAIKEGLERMTGRPVDLLTESSVNNRYLKQQIDAEKVTLFAA